MPLKQSAVLPLMHRKSVSSMDLASLIIDGVVC